MLRSLLLAAVLVGSAFALRAQDATDALTRYKAASGGTAWDAVSSWHGDGTMQTGGLSGEFHTTIDLRGGRSVDSYKLGSIEGGDGYDGKQGWERDPGGEIAVLDTPDALRRARSQAWLDAHAYWYPQRGKSTFGKVETIRADGRDYQVVVATPEGGDAVTLWFAADSGLLARAIQRQGPDTATAVFDDYRKVDGMQLPFHVLTDLTDAAGRTDPRRRTEVQLTRATLDVAIADADFAVPAMKPTARIDDQSGITTIAFELINNHIYVDGSIDGKAAHFLVDTGGVNMLTPAAAHKFGIEGEGKLAGSGVGDERMDLAFGHAREVRVGAATLDKPVFYIIDAGPLAAVEGVEFDGLVGYEMFRRFGVQIDYAQHKLTLSESAKFAAPSGASAVPFTLDDRIPIVSGTLDGQPIRISVDTGSRSSLTLHAPFVREHDLLARYHAGPEAVLGWGVGGAARERPARLGTLRLGDQAIVGIAGELHTGNKGSFANPDLGGNLGGGVLRRFTVGFDYTNRKMYLAPNAEFGKPDAFDRSGLWLLGEDGVLKIADVAPDSAALRAGLRIDDRITTLGGEPIAKRTLGGWRQRLRELPAGSKLVVEFRRGDSAQKSELTLADRIPGETSK